MKITVGVASQTLTLRDGAGEVLAHYRVSTARNGTGEAFGSHRTPRGRHRIRARIGASAPLNSVFVGRRATGEIFSPALRRAFPERDWILTRILWLSGCEVGRNRLGSVDTMRRYIYIHGCPDEDILGVPGSRGCVKMRNADIMALFDHVPAGTEVWIEEHE